MVPGSSHCSEGQTLESFLATTVYQTITAHLPRVGISKREEVRWSGLTDQSEAPNQDASTAVILVYSWKLPELAESHCWLEPI